MIVWMTTVMKSCFESSDDVFNQTHEHITAIKTIDLFWKALNLPVCDRKQLLAICIMSNNVFFLKRCLFTKCTLLK